jgi:2-methylcitrate dehydratase PrpD
VIHFKGTPKNPMTRSEVEEKARKLTRRILPEGQLERAVEMVDGLETIDDVSRLTQTLELAESRQSE